MSTVKVEVQLSSDELLKAVEQLNQTDLERFVSQVIAIQAQRKALNLPRLRGITLTALMESLGIKNSKVIQGALHYVDAPYSFNMYVNK
jgi:hypothetical protein